MIVFEVGGSGLVRQREHARLSRIMAERSTLDTGPIVRRAIRHHDDGWEDYDEQPRFDDNGELIDYRSVPLEDHLEILEGSVESCREIDPYAGWLVSRHGCSFHEGKTGEPVEGFLENQEEIREKLRKEIDVDDETRRRDFDWLQFTDALSLFVLDPWNDQWSWDRETPGTVTVQHTDEGVYRYEGAGFEPGTHRFSFLYRTMPESSRDSEPRTEADAESVDLEEGTVTLNVRA